MNWIIAKEKEIQDIYKQEDIEIKEQEPSKGKQ